jgi:hypothetical protein
VGGNSPPHAASSSAPAASMIETRTAFFMFILDFEF